VVVEHEDTDHVLILVDFALCTKFGLRGSRYGLGWSATGLPKP
jgi:hypothetical protein